jgi:hypothetical protein
LIFFGDRLSDEGFVFIQFGHNDQKVNSPKQYTNPYSTYRTKFEWHVNEICSKGAVPVILSSLGLSQSKNEKNRIERLNRRILIVLFRLI